MNITIRKPICIIGLGPAGIGACLEFVERGMGGNIICVEAGSLPELKRCSVNNYADCSYDSPCKVISGFGGCSILSGGKLSKYPAGRSLSTILGSEFKANACLSDCLERIGKYLEYQSPSISIDDRNAAERHYTSFGFEFRYYDACHYSHKSIIKAMTTLYDKYISAGVDIHLNSSVQQIDVSSGLYYLTVATDKGDIQIISDVVILGVGRCGYALLNKLSASSYLKSIPNKLDVGVRIEFPTSMWADIDRYHSDLKLHCNEYRTFCVCKDGILVPYRRDDISIIDGSSLIRDNSGFTNLALIKRVFPPTVREHIDLVERIKTSYLSVSGGVPLRQSLLSYIGTNANGYSINEGSISYWQEGDCNSIFPHEIGNGLREFVKMFCHNLISEKNYRDVSVYSPEMEYMTPGFSLINGFETSCKNLYMIGDCIGMFRGILQALCSGMECAKQIVSCNHVR